MEKTFKDLLQQLLPLKKRHRIQLNQLKQFLSSDQLSDVTYLLKTKKIGLTDSATHISKKLTEISSIKQFVSLVEDVPVTTLIKDLNSIIREQTFAHSFNQFSSHAKERMLQYIAPNILGMDDIKYATLLQLFSKERFHILLLGDPGTGKTDILRSSSVISPISSFGLGSGTSGAGLSVSMKGRDVQKGLLLLAHNGLCCIDELNLMKKDDRAAFYSAMEKGFITYDKGGSHKKFQANVRILATANPEGDRFVGKSFSIIKQQVPFDSALLSRFHLVYIVRKPGVQELVSITRKIIKSSTTRLREEDLDFLKSYVEHALELDVTFDKKHTQLVAHFIEDLKTNEQNYLVDIGPRLVHGIMRMAQARARMFLRTTTIKEDVDEAIVLVKKSLIVDGVVRA
ncbi:ATP-binding protein [Candidatus Woesearchaeota archaeon]|nr:ATP-binding protein [Candidatus Woesearchaeota archaeon]